jgi:hypothetical protein
LLSHSQEYMDKEEGKELFFARAMGVLAFDIAQLQIRHGGSKPGDQGICKWTSIRSCQDLQRLFYTFISVW